MPSTNTCQTIWNGAPVIVTARLVPRFAWQTASIDVSVGGHVILRTDGVFKLIGKHVETFELDGTKYSAEISWGNAALQSFPINLSVDGVSIIESRVPLSNWWLALWPWVIFIGWCVWRFAL